MAEDLTGFKPAYQSQTIQGAVLSILASLGSLAVMIQSGVPATVLVPAAGATLGAVWGSVMSIMGRLKSTKKIG